MWCHLVATRWSTPGSRLKRDAKTSAMQLHGAVSTVCVEGISRRGWGNESEITHKLFDSPFTNLYIMYPNSYGFSNHIQKTANSLQQSPMHLNIFCVFFTGLRDWYLRNTLGSTHQNQPNGKVNTGVNAKVNGGAKCKTSGGGALQGRRRTHGVAHQLSFQTETSHNQAPPHRKQMLPHSATFHGHPLHGR